MDEALSQRSKQLDSPAGSWAQEDLWLDGVHLPLGSSVATRWPRKTAPLKGFALAGISSPALVPPQAAEQEGRR